ncbi:hypothetical protein F5X99DRAFT_422686 [Biscogniauxia marginata]|nr:hypothetical protein F5X99DRAFT_422686 [Biscogniauxia marginata]
MASNPKGQGPKQNGAPPKHRACDECRTRKLACTKEPDGCLRCQREGIPCHYSPQKQMGRPRKRPREESLTNDDHAFSTPTTSTSGDAAIATADVTDAPPSKTPMMEIPPSTEDPGLAFINFLVGEDMNLGLDQHLFQDQPSIMGMDVDTLGASNGEVQTQGKGHPWNFGFTGDAFGDINYDPIVTNDSPSFSASNLDPALFMPPSSLSNSTTEPSTQLPLPPEQEQVPDLSPNTASTPESSTSTYVTGGTNTNSTTNNNQPSCSCTANLYLALDRMQKLPVEVEPAIRQARLAAKIAYEVVNCPGCSLKLESPQQALAPSPASVQNFQNLMLLATLIPSIVHAYERILHVVDAEAQRAAAERRSIVFRLRGLGGIWGSLSEDVKCGASGALERREMEPSMWRLVVRALLKVDVYGISGGTWLGPGDRVDGGDDPFHIGLKDIVLLMENRAKARHAFMDAMVASGAWQEPPCAALKLHKDGEQPTCQRIIAIARTSVDQLVIA